MKKILYSLRCGPPSAQEDNSHQRQREEGAQIQHGGQNTDRERLSCHISSRGYSYRLATQLHLHRGWTDGELLSSP